MKPQCSSEMAGCSSGSTGPGLTDEAKVGHVGIWTGVTELQTGVQAWLLRAQWELMRQFWHVEVRASEPSCWIDWNWSIERSQRQREQRCRFVDCPVRSDGVEMSPQLIGSLLVSYTCLLCLYDALSLFGLFRVVMKAHSHSRAPLWRGFLVAHAWKGGSSSTLGWDRF